MRVENGSDEKQIEACSAIIQAGRETKKNLARAYSHRGTAYSHKGDRGCGLYLPARQAQAK